MVSQSHPINICCAESPLRGFQNSNILHWRYQGVFAVAVYRRFEYHSKRSDVPQTVLNARSIVQIAPLAPVHSRIQACACLPCLTSSTNCYYRRGLAFSSEWEDSVAAILLLLLLALVTAANKQILYEGPLQLPRPTAARDRSARTTKLKGPETPLPLKRLMLRYALTVPRNTAQAKKAGPVRRPEIAMERQRGVQTI